MIKLLLILLFVSLQISQISCNPLRHHRSQQTPEDNQNNLPAYTLKHRCSSSMVKITSDGRIRANGSAAYDSTHHFVFVSLGTQTDEFYIKRKDSARYICFNRKGRLRSRRRPIGNGRCTFTEEPIPTSGNEYLTRYRSVTNGKYTWYLGFNRTGHPLPGWKAPQQTREEETETDKPKENCFLFHKSLVQYSNSQSSNSAENNLSIQIRSGAT